MYIYVFLSYWKMWEPQHLTTLRASKACRGEDFTLPNNKISIHNHVSCLSFKVCITEVTYTHIHICIYIVTSNEYYIHFSECKSQALVIFDVQMKADWWLLLSGICVDVSYVLKGFAASISRKRRYLSTRSHGCMPPEGNVHSMLTLEKLKPVRILTTGTKLAARRAGSKASLRSVCKGNVPSYLSHGN
jgi:hypothetical protein